jgi:hypothetical protein
MVSGEAPTKNLLNWPRINADTRESEKTITLKLFNQIRVYLRSSAAKTAAAAIQRAEFLLQLLSADYADYTDERKDQDQPLRTEFVADVLSA